MVGPTHVLCISPSAEQRLAQATRFLRALPSRSQALLLLPGLGAGAPLLARALDAGQARFDWRKRTLDQLARELALPALAASGRVPLSGVSLEALVGRVLHQLADTPALARHAPLIERPGFARAMSRTIDELRLSGIAAARVASHAPALAEVLAAYERELDALQLADRALVFASATRALTQRPCDVPLLALDVPLMHTCEADFALALGAGRARACVTVARGDERAEAHWRAALGPRAEVMRLVPTEDDDLARLQRGLFAPRGEGASGERAHNVSIVSSPGEAREVVEIARSLQEAAQRGVPFDQMAIALRASEGYRAEIEEALERAQVPAHFADGVRRPLSSGRAFLALLACAREGLSARAFAEYLSLGEHPRSDEDGAVATPRRWERMLVDASVINGGPERWRRRIQGLIHQLRDAQVALQREEPERVAQAADPNNPAQPVGYALDIAQLEELERFALPLLERLSALPAKRAPWSEWLDALQTLARAALRTPDGVIGVLTELAPLAPISVSLAEVQRVLAPRLSSFVLPSTGFGAGKVFVGTIDDVRGRAFDLVFVPGLAERVFPPRIAEDPLLPDELRRALGGELWLSEERVARERLLLRIAVGAARERLVLSYPRFDLAHGRPRVPSFYGLEVLQAIDGKLPAFDELSRRADPGAAARMGFPAPERAQRAIDDAEYDLAMLGRMLRAPASERTGAARYLLEANVHLARALRFRARRWELQRFSAADGFVAADDAGRTLLAEHRIVARSYSASALAHLAACPYRFYLAAIARVSERPEVAAVDELDARQRGVLFHRVQRAVLATLRDRDLLPLDPSALQEAQAVLAEAFVRLSAEARDRYAPSIDGVFEAGLKAIERDLEEWLVRTLEERAFVPRHFELGFGIRSGELDAHSRTEAVVLANGITLVGAIDLVEQSGQGERAELRATDYKTSRMPERLGRLTGGRTLQPLLYALALEQLFPGQKVASGRLYYCTARGAFSSHEVPLDDAARALAKELAQNIDTLLEQGLFPAAPAELQEDRQRFECERCAYRAVCGPHEPERVGRIKSRDLERLAPLHRLRNLP